MIFYEIFLGLWLLCNIFTTFLHFVMQLSVFSISYIDSMLHQGVAHVRHNLPHLATHVPRAGILRRSIQHHLDSFQRSRSSFSARFSSRETFRRAYCKRLALRNRFQLTEAEFDDDLFVFCQFHTIDEADQKLPAGVGRIQKLLHQLSCSVFCADRAFFL